jgi:peroxiredoxin
MENNKNSDAKQWVEDRLSMLLPNDSWQPDLAGGLASFRMKRDKTRLLRSRWIWATTCTTLLGILIITFPTSRLLAARYVSACVNLLGRLSGDAPKLTYAELGDRKPTPDVTIITSGGMSTALSEVHGKVVLLTFWKPDCRTCDIEMAWFKEFQQDYRERNFVFLDHQVVGGDDILRLFGGPQTLPTTFLIDKTGRIAVSHVGLCPKHEYQTAIEALLNET